MLGLATVSVALLAGAALLQVALVVGVLRQPRGESAPAMLALLLAVLVWVVAYAGEILAGSLPAVVLLARLQYLGIVAAPVAWLLFAARYTRADGWVTRRRLALLALIPLLTLALVWTNAAHRLIWREVALSPGPLSVLQATYGPWFWVHTLFSYLCIATGSWLLARATFSNHRLFRWQGALLLLSATIPWFANIFYVLRVWPLAPLDPSPLAFGLSALLLGWSMLRYRLLDLAPIPPELVVGGIDAGVLVVDQRGRIVELNHAAAAIFGRVRADALSLPAASLLAPYPALLESSLAGRPLRTEVTVGLLPEARIYAAQVTPLHDQRRRSVGSMVLLHDITERKLAEEQRHRAALRRLAEQVTLQHVATAVTAQLSLEAIFSSVVTEVHAAFGYPLVGIYLVEDERLALKAQVAPAPLAERLELDTGVCAAALRDNRPLFVRNVAAEPSLATVAPAASEVIVLPLWAGGGEVLGCILVGAAGEPALSDDDLALLQLLAAQVSVAITNGRLFADLQASELAARTAARARSEFLANMSHEVRTPLYGVIGAASLLLNRTSDDEQRLLLELINAGAGSLLSLLSALLDYALLVSGKPDLELAPFALRRCVEDAVEAVRPRAQAKGLDLRLKVDAQVPEVLISDPARLQQILSLLLGNAVKYTPSGAVTVSVGARPLPGQRNMLTFAVQDTGPGIDPDLRERLLRLLSQSEDAAGGGLGLPMSRRLSELLGGTLWFESAVGQGSTFSFSIVGEQPAGEANFDLSGAVPLLHGRQALVVAASETLRRFLGLQLRAWGLRPTVTGSTDEALACLDDGELFDIVLVAPEGGPPSDATSVTALRRHRPAAELPIVLLAGAGAGSGLYRAAAGGVQAVLQRPLRPAQLHAVLVSLFAQPREPAQPPAAANGTPRVLLVEDDPTNQLLTAHLVRQLAYEVEVVDSGPAALEALEQRHFDLVLLDVRMSGMDGIAVAEEVCRRWPREERPRLIALTANAVIGDRERCLAAGMDDYLSKPIALEDLRAALAHGRLHAAMAAVPQAARLATVAGPAPTFDGASLGWTRERLGGAGVSAFGRVIKTYLDDSNRLLAEMGEAAVWRQGSRLAHLAHKLKSSSAIVAAARLSQLCAALESAASTGNPATWAADVAAIRAEYERVRSYLEAITEE